MSRFDKLNREIYTAILMAQLEIDRVKNVGSGFHYTFKTEGLNAQADFDPLTGVAEVNFEQAANLTSALEAVVSKLQSEACKWGTNPIFPLRIDIHAGKFEKQLAEIADRFGLKGPIPADESGAEGVLYRAELPLAG